MRFEIRAGGTLAILLGLGALSGAVFLLGLVAGYEMGRQEEGNRQFASVYPLPPPPAAEASPSPAADLGLAAAPTSTPAAVASVAAQAPPQVNESAAAAPRELAAPPATPAAEAPVTEPKPPSRSSLAKLESPSTGSSAGARAEHRHERELASAPSATRRKPYSIQIEAAMDRAGAEAMVARLRRAGYSSYIIESAIAGQTWYRVRVGPYATEEEASEAEATLHHRYSGGIMH
jgi:cell division septation protein DedD